MIVPFVPIVVLARSLSELLQVTQNSPALVGMLILSCLHNWDQFVNDLPQTRYCDSAAAREIFKRHVPIEIDIDPALGTHGFDRGVLILLNCECLTMALRPDHHTTRAVL